MIFQTFIKAYTLYQFNQIKNKDSEIVTHEKIPKKKLINIKSYPVGTNYQK